MNEILNLNFMIDIIEGKGNKDEKKIKLRIDTNYEDEETSYEINNNCKKNAVLPTKIVSNAKVTSTKHRVTQSHVSIILK